MKLNLQSPANWEDFEKLCFHLWRDLWGDSSAHRHGRQGQRQNGVDIYGTARYENHITGIQCKGRNKNYGKQLTTKEIDAECEKARRFSPELGTFIIATTSPRDTLIQEYCLNLSAERIYDFKVDIWSWDDIVDEIQSRPDLMNTFYPALKDDAELLNEITLSRFTSLNKIDAFFSRPGLISIKNERAKRLQYDLAYELAMNAFYHGLATQFIIQIDGFKTTFKDNGAPFNPCDLLDHEIANGGSVTLHYAQDYFNYNYEYRELDEENIFEISYIDKFDNSNQNDPRHLLLNMDSNLTREQLTRYVSTEVKLQCSDAQRIIVDVSGRDMSTVAMSIADGLTIALEESQSAIVYLPGNLYFEEELKKRVNSRQIRFIKKGWPD